MLRALRQTWIARMAGRWVLKRKMRRLLKAIKADLNRLSSAVQTRRSVITMVAPPHAAEIGQGDDSRKLHSLFGVIENPPEAEEYKVFERVIRELYDQEMSFDRNVEIEFGSMDGNVLQVNLAARTGVGAKAIQTVLRRFDSEMKRAMRKTP